MKEKGHVVFFYFTQTSQCPAPYLEMGGRAAPHLSTQHNGTFPFQDSLLPLSVTRDAEPVHLQPSLRTQTMSDLRCVLDPTEDTALSDASQVWHAGH